MVISIMPHPKPPVKFRWQDVVECNTGKGVIITIATNIGTRVLLYITIATKQSSNRERDNHSNRGS